MTAAIATPPRTIRVGRVFLLLFAGLLFAVGWVAAKTVVGVLWVLAAVGEGWSTAGGPQRSRTR